MLAACTENPVIRRLTFTLSEVLLPPGQYEAIPYLLVDPKGVPQPLLAKLGESVNELSASYLSKPMRREGGGFKVMN